MESYDMLILSAVCNQDNNKLDQIYSENGTAFVLAVYSLYKKGLVTTSYDNFVWGGDNEEPLDIGYLEKVYPTYKGIYLYLYIHQHRSV